MPLTLAESLSLARRARDLLADVEDLDPELTSSTTALFYTLRDSVAKSGPAGHRVTKKEARAILAGALEVARHALRVDASRYQVLIAHLLDLAADVAAEWAD
jgi:hypothetical protein